MSNGRFAGGPDAETVSRPDTRTATYRQRTGTARRVPSRLPRPTSATFGEGFEVSSVDHRLWQNPDGKTVLSKGP